MWSMFNASNKVFNVFASGLVLGMAGLQIWAGYNIYLKKNYYDPDYLEDQITSKLSSGDAKHEAVSRMLDIDEERQEIKKIDKRV
jgi:hypothetical protein